MSLRDILNGISRWDPTPLPTFPSPGGPERHLVQMADGSRMPFDPAGMHFDQAAQAWRYRDEAPPAPARPWSTGRGQEQPGSPVAPGAAALERLRASGAPVRALRAVPTPTDQEGAQSPGEAVLARVLALGDGEESEDYRRAIADVLRVLQQGVPPG